MTSPAYFFFQVQINDAEGMKPYQEKVLATVLANHGTTVVAGGAIETREGSDPQGKIFIVRFDSTAQAHAWYDSPDYQAIIGHRHASAECNAFVLEGIDL
jgi:uncharacterized protein (DUF1330 family)